MRDAFKEGTTRAVRRAAALAVAAVALLAPASPASAAQRYASADSTNVTGSCTALLPCKIDHAVNGASAGDEVIVNPGTYTVAKQLAPAASVDIHGVPGEPRPRLIGSATKPTVYLAYGGSLSHLYVEANRNLVYAVELTGATGTGLELYSTKGGGAELNGVNGGTVLRDSVVRSAGASAVQTKDGATAGPAKVLNVTAIASGTGATGVKGKQTAATTVVRNVIARGELKDVDMTGAQGAVDHSNFRAAWSTGHTDGGGNQSAEPMFADSANGDLHVVAGSPTIDAGTGDAALGRTDLDGRARTIGTAPDIGAYEYEPPPPPADTPDTTTDTTDTVTDPTGPIADPTTDTTDTTTDATDPATHPAGPIADTTDTTTDTTDPATDPTGPITDTADTTTDTTDPVTGPVGPITDPTDPSTDPTDPVTDPPAPITDTTTDTTDPDTGTTDATGPTGGGGDVDGGSFLLPPAPPVMGKTVELESAKGTVLVRPSGSSEFVELGAGASVPVGTTVDATRGVVELTSAKDAAGATQTGSFWGGRFRVEQSRSGGGYTDLVLDGGRFGRCGVGSARRGRPARSKAPRARRARAARGRVRVARRLWGRDKRGKFRTRGRNGHAVVRGTEWLTEDRCDGTFFAVKEGAIDVRPNRGGKTVRVEAGGRHLVRARVAHSRHSGRGRRGRR